MSDYISPEVVTEILLRAEAASEIIDTIQRHLQIMVLPNLQLWIHFQTSQFHHHQQIKTTTGTTKTTGTYYLTARATFLEKNANQCTVTKPFLRTKDLNSPLVPNSTLNNTEVFFPYK